MSDEKRDAVGVSRGAVGLLRCRNFVTALYFALCGAFVVSVDRFIENYAIVEIWGISRGCSAILS